MDIFGARMSILSLAALCVALKFKPPLGDPKTTNLFTNFALLNV